MSMKLCINCQYFGKEVQTVGPGQLANIPVCKHPDFVNPVDGSLLPPGLVRKEKDLCGLGGSGFVQSTETPPTLPPPEPKRILTSV